MKDRSAPTRSQAHEIAIDAPEEAVWKAIVDGEELTRWFVDAAKVEPGVGGSFRLSWDGAEARITAGSTCGSRTSGCASP